MALRYRILSGVGVFVALALVSVAVLLSHDSPCTAPDPVPEGAQRMKAIVQRCYGPPDVLEMEEIARPTVAGNEILVKVHAASLNPVDWHFMRGTPYFIRLSSGLGAPKDTRVGVDFSGTVAAVGSSVTRFKPGDEVFGGTSGALAEYVTVREDGAVVLKPANLTFEEAGSVGVAAITALQGLRDTGGIAAGQKVLINGASGGVGTFAVQIAKSFGAEVTGVCSTRNLQLVRSLGADHVIDYTQEDFTRNGQQYDLVLDNVGNQPLRAYRHVLKPDGTLVIIGGPSEDPWLGPMIQPIKAMLLSPFVSQKLVMMLSDLNQKDLGILSGLMQAGKVKPVIDRRYSLSEVRTAMRYLETGHARGKVVVNVAYAPQPELSQATHQ